MIFKSVDLSAVPDLMYIEQACHPHPMTEKTMQSCFSQRYFNKALVVNDNEQKDNLPGESLVGFYLAEMAGPDCTLMDICIAPAHQGKGYAKALIEDLLKEARSRRAESIFLEVRVSNHTAISLYERAGFNEIGIRKNYYPAAQGREDAKLMALMVL